MKALKYMFTAAVAALALSSCLSDPTEGVVMPEYDEVDDPATPPDDPDNNKPDYSLPLDRGFIHLKGRELKSLNVISATGLTDAEKVVVSTLAGNCRESERRPDISQRGWPCKRLAEGNAEYL